MTNQKVKIAVIGDKHFFPVFAWKDPSIVLFWWAETDLKNITWERWIMITPHWPFFFKMCLFYDEDADIWYPEIRGEAPEREDNNEPG